VALHAIDHDRLRQSGHFQDGGHDADRVVPLMADFTPAWVRLGQWTTIPLPVPP